MVFCVFVLGKVFLVAVTGIPTSARSLCYLGRASERPLLTVSPAAVMPPRVPFGADGILTSLTILPLETILT